MMTQEYFIEDVCVKDNDLTSDQVKAVVEACNAKGAKFWTDGRHYIAASSNGYTHLEKDDEGNWDIDGHVGRPGSREVIDSATWVELVMKTLENENE